MNYLNYNKINEDKFSIDSNVSIIGSQPSSQDYTSNSSIINGQSKLWNKPASAAPSSQSVSNGGYGGYRNYSMDNSQVDNMGYKLNMETMKSDEERISLKLKNNQIEMLENEITRLKNILEKFTHENNISNTVEIPKNYERVFQKLYQSLNEKEFELNETKLRLESILTAIALNPTQTMTENGRYDEQEVSHKILVKLKVLEQENETMLKMLSFGKSKEKDIEIGLLKNELFGKDERIEQLLKEIELLKK